MRWVKDGEVVPIQDGPDFYKMLSRRLKDDWCDQDGKCDVRSQDQLLLSPGEEWNDFKFVEGSELQHEVHLDALESLVSEMDQGKLDLQNFKFDWDVPLADVEDLAFAIKYLELIDRLNQIYLRNNGEALEVKVVEQNEVSTGRPMPMQLSTIITKMKQNPEKFIGSDHRLMINSLGPWYGFIISSWVDWGSI